MNTKITIDPNDLEGDNIPTLSDFSGTLNELNGEVQKLIQTYGGEGHIRFDAGYNNITCSVVSQDMINQEEARQVEALNKRTVAAEALERKQYEKLKKKFG